MTRLLGRVRRAALGLLAGAAFLCAAPAFAADDGLVAIPPFQSLVTDLTGTLDAGQQAALEQRLREFQARKGSQVAVLLVPTTKPESVEQYALRVAEAWQVGRKQVDDGVLFLVAKNDRSMRIEVGYGLEGAIPDATANRILREIVTPRFQAGDFYGGIDQATDRIVRLIDGEPLPEPQARQEGGQDGAFAGLLFGGIAVGMFLRNILGRVPGALLTGGAVGVIAWLVTSAVGIALGVAIMAFIFTLVGGLGIGTGGTGGRGGGSWGGGRGRGGGFGGGGGGGFGGGGASGRW